MKNRLTAFAVLVTIALTALSFSQYCGYTMSYVPPVGGTTPCILLPLSYSGTPYGTCTYYQCENATACSGGSNWQQVLVEYQVSLVGTSYYVTPGYPTFTPTTCCDCTNSYNNYPPDQ